MYHCTKLCEVRYRWRGTSRYKTKMIGNWSEEELAKESDGEKRRNREKERKVSKKKR